MARSTWNLALNQQDRQMVYQEVEKQFDGDYNVLLETLIAQKMAANRSKPNETLQVFDRQIKDFTQQVMKESKEQVYPQIFIPFYEDLKQKGKLGTAPPVLVFRDGPPTTDGKYRGYAFKDGELVDRGSISEEFARENEVWVLSLNERVNNRGEIHSSKISNYYQSLITALTIKGKNCMKEDWVGGKVDVNAIRWFDDFNQSSPSARYYGEAAPKGDRVANVSRKDAKKENVQNINFVFITGWNTDPSYMSLEYAYYVIFEYDPWPAGKHDVNFGNLTYQYRSYEGYYDSNILHRNSADNYSVNSGCISWVMD